MPEYARHLAHYVEVVNKISVPKQRCVVLEVFRSKPVAQVSGPRRALVEYSRFLVHALVNEVLRVVFHGRIMFFEQGDVAILQVAFPRNGNSRASPEHSPESSAYRGNVGKAPVGALHVAHGPQVVAQELRPAGKVG